VSHVGKKQRLLLFFGNSTPFFAKLPKMRRRAGGKALARAKRMRRIAQVVGQTVPALIDRNRKEPQGTACPTGVQHPARTNFPVYRKTIENAENKDAGWRIVALRVAARVFVTAADHGQIDPAQTDPKRIDPALVGALYERYADELGLFLKGVLRNADLAAEALQNTFAKAVESGHTAREDSVKGWLFRVAFHEAALLRRRGHIHERSLRHMARNNQSTVTASETPDERLSRLERLAELRRALGELPPEQRQVVEMRIYEEKSFAEIATELSAPIGTILTRMRLALKKLSRQVPRPDGDH
jgi:RNA polymerase sigma-70 factor (ECF subfamily)